MYSDGERGEKYVARNVHREVSQRCDLQRSARWKPVKSRGPRRHHRAPRGPRRQRPTQAPPGAVIREAPRSVEDIRSKFIVRPESRAISPPLVMTKKVALMSRSHMIICSERMRKKSEAPMQEKGPQSSSSNKQQVQRTKAGGPQHAPATRAATRYATRSATGYRLRAERAPQ